MNLYGFLQLPYSISVEYSDQTAMDPPSVNITQTGTIPTEPETFQVHLPCTGKRSAEVSVDISLNVTAYPKLKVNSTRVTVQRTKICLSGELSFKQTLLNIKTGIC